VKNAIIFAILLAPTLLNAQSNGKTFDTNLGTFAKLPILSWESEELINGKPNWEGFLLVKAKLNGVYDISGGLQNEETFNVGQIDVWGTDDRKRFNMDMHQTQVRLWSKRKTETGDFVGYLEGDFWAGNNTYRLRHAWFDYKFLHVGQDWSFFGDKNVWPNVLDWDGPPSGVWRRAVQVKFYFETAKNWKYEVGFENPGAEFRFNEDIAPVITPSYPVMPDMIGAIQKGISTGHVRLSAIYRQLVYAYAGSNQSVSGYGTSLSGLIKHNPDKNHMLQFQFVVGKGISSYLASFGGRNYDGVPTSANTISAVPVVGGWIAYEYWFTKQWHSNIVVGISNFETDAITSLNIPDPNYTATDTEVNIDHKYIVINLMYNPTPGLSLGIEYNLGNREMGYEGMIDTGNGIIPTLDQKRSASRVNFGAFFDF
jgi:hypothetical protein